MDLGKKGETVAAKYLKKRRYSIIDRNFKCKYGEIDIIAKNKNVICFVEVKARSNEHFGRPIDAITPYKVQHMVKSAQYYILKKSLEDQEVRIDIIEIEFKEKKPKIRHTENAVIL